MQPKIIGKSKISWCTHGWNFVVGCNRGCTIETIGFDCYAKRQFEKFNMAELYAKQEAKYIKSKIPAANEEWLVQSAAHKFAQFKPVFLEHAFAKRFPKKPSSIFVCAMTDPAYWKLEWTERAFEKINQHPEHTFIMLTKSPHIYAHIESPPNVAVGVTALNENEIKIGQKCLKNLVNKNITFLSIEPLQREIEPGCIDRDAIDLVVVGGLSGPGVQPKKHWVDSFRWYYYNSHLWGQGENRIKLFEKDNLKGIINRELIQELPWVTGGKK